MNNSKMHQEREADMQKRENDLMIKMSKRMNVMEEQLKEVKTRLSDAIKTIAEKDKEIEKLKEKVLKEGIEKLAQPENQRKFPEREQYNLTEELITSSDEYKERKPKPQYSELAVNESLPEVNKAKSLSSKQIRRNQIDEAKKLTEVIEQRMMKSKPPQNVLSEEEHNMDSSTFSSSISGLGINSLPKNDLKLNQSATVSEESFSNVYSETDISLEKYTDQTSQEMDEEYERLANQVTEMEQFLADYGLIWVGDANIKDGDSTRKVQASIGFSPNFDKIIMIISEMNDVVSSESHVQISKKEGKFKKADVLRLTLYADGIQLEDNPFREYSSESVQEFFRDLEDGYYPTELKDIYPDGVIFRVIDKRLATYEETKKGQVEPFSGEGHRLGSVGDGSVKQRRKIPPYPGPAGRTKKKTNGDEEYVTEVSYEEIKHVKNKNMNVRKSVDNLNKINEVHKDVSQEEMKKKREKNNNAREIPIDFNKRKEDNKVTTQEGVQENQNSSIMEIPVALENVNEVSGSIPKIDSNSNNEEFSRIVIQSEVGINEKNLDNTEKVREIEEDSKITIPKSDVPENNSVEILSTEKILTPVEKKIKTSQEKTNISVENGNSQGLRFRDNINITNITYNEAPVIAPQQPVINHQSGCLQDSYCNCPAASAEYRKTKQKSRPHNGKSNSHGARMYEFESEEDPYSKRSPYPGSADSVTSKDPITGVTEYQQQYDKNVKNIIEAIKNRHSTPTPKIEINPNEKYEHFTFLGSDSTIDQSNFGQSEIHLDLPSTGDNSKAEISNSEVNPIKSETVIEEQIGLDEDHKSKESITSVSEDE